MLENVETVKNCQTENTRPFNYNIAVLTFSFHTRKIRRMFFVPGRYAK